MSKDKYTIPDGADWNIYINYDNKIKLDNLKAFYKEYNYDVECDYDYKDDGISVAINRIDIENQGISNELSYIIDEEEKSEMYNDAVTDNFSEKVLNVLKRVSLSIFIDSRNVDESVLVLIFALYLSKQTDTIVFDTYNGCYLTVSDIQNVLSGFLSGEQCFDIEGSREIYDESNIVNECFGEIISSLSNLLNDKEKNKTLSIIYNIFDRILSKQLSNDELIKLKDVLAHCKTIAMDNNITELLEKCKKIQMDILLRNTNY